MMPVPDYCGIITSMNIELFLVLIMLFTADVLLFVGYPVRSMYPQAASERLTIASDMMEEDRCDDHKEDSFNEQQEDVGSRAKRLLPDRTHAAHNRANEKLVHFIVKQHMVDKHLLV